MTFPFSSRGCVDVSSSSADAEVLVARMTAWLEREKARDIRREGNRIRFRAPQLFAVGSSNPFPLIDGEFEVAGEPASPAVRYRIRYTRLLIVASMMVFGYLGPLFYFVSKFNGYECAEFIGAVWLWMVGINYLFSVLRLPSLIRIAAAGRIRKWYE